MRDPPIQNVGNGEATIVPINHRGAAVQNRARGHVRYDEKNNKWLASMNTTKEALKAAPEFKYPK
jgi:hypothetical protein